MPLCYGILTLGNFGLLSPKFLLFEAEWNVQHKSIQTSFLLLIFFSYIPTKRIIAPGYMNFILIFRLSFVSFLKHPKHVSVYDQPEVSPSHGKGKPVYDNTPEYSVSDVFFPKLSLLLPVLLQCRFLLGVPRFLREG